MVEGLDDRTDSYPKLSRSFESMKTEYDVVVVGSGYGAGVAASRMARAGKSVAILEVGWEIRRMILLNIVDLRCPACRDRQTDHSVIAGSYPHTLLQCLKQMHISGSFDKHRTLERWFPTRDTTQLFQLVLGNGQHAFSAHGRFALSPRQLGLVSQHGAGLGGGSLINTGVFLEADERTLQMSPWPPEIKKDPSILHSCKFNQSELCCGWLTSDGPQITGARQLCYNHPHIQKNFRG